MTTYLANYSKGQMKIQQMAFALVAMMIFFGIVALFYFSIKLNSLKSDAQSLQEQEAKELVRKIASSPEFSWTSTDCSNCIDLDKVSALKSRKSYSEFWNLDFLQVEMVYPLFSGECDKSNYPQCGKITIINNENHGLELRAFVSVCRWEQDKGGYAKCGLGRISAAGINLK